MDNSSLISWLDDYPLITPTLEPTDLHPGTGTGDSPITMRTSQQRTTYTLSPYATLLTDTNNIYPELIFDLTIEYKPLDLTPLWSPKSVENDRELATIKSDLAELINTETYFPLLKGVPNNAPTVDEQCIEGIASEMQNTYPFGQRASQHFGDHSSETSKPSDETCSLLPQDGALSLTTWESPFQTRDKTPASSDVNTRVKASSIVTAHDVVQEYDSTNFLHRSSSDVEYVNSIQSCSEDVELDLPDLSSAAGTSKGRITQESISSPFWQTSQLDDAAIRYVSLDDSQDYSFRMQWNEFKTRCGDNWLPSQVNSLEGIMHQLCLDFTPRTHPVVIEGKWRSVNCLKSAHLGMP